MTEPEHPGPEGAAPAPDGGADDDAAPDPDAPIEIPIDGSLDLHLFRPRDVKSVVNDYLDECRVRGILSIRIAHGKGIGTLREIVHATLEKRDDVARYRLDSESAGGWGATLVDLKE